MNGRLAGILALLNLAAFALAACSGAATTDALPTKVPPTAAPSPTDTSIAPPTYTAPAATPTAAPLPAQTPTSTATPSSAFLQIPAVNCCYGRTLPAGVYDVPAWLGLPLTVELEEGWRVLNEKAARLFLIGRGKNVQNNPSQMIAFLNVTGNTTPAALIDSVQQAPELSTLAEPVNVMLAGFTGLQLDSIANPNPAYAGSPQDDIPPGVQFLPVFMKYFAPGFAWTTSSPEARVRTVVLTMGDHVLLLYLEAPPDEFDEFAVNADSILQSLALIEK